MQAIEQFVRADGGGIDSLNIRGLRYFSTKKRPFYFGNMWLQADYDRTGHYDTLIVFPEHTE
jgi:hypothetical protein